MSRLKFLALALVFCWSFSLSYAQAPMHKQIGFGIMVGDPTGGTLKIWTNPINAFVIDAGSSYFGSPRIDVDYLWHFDAFHSKIANLYAGPGGVIGVGEGTGFWYRNHFVRTGNDVGLGFRGVFGVNFVPERTPLEIFLEMGVLVGFSPAGSSVDAALGLRFYP
jgi:hypothetical protein